MAVLLLACNEAMLYFCFSSVPDGVGNEIDVTNHFYLGLIDRTSFCFLRLQVHQSKLMSSYETNEQVLLVKFDRVNVVKILLFILIFLFFVLFLSVNHVEVFILDLLDNLEGMVFIVL